MAPDAYTVLTVGRGSELAAAWPIVFEEGPSGLVIDMPLLTQKLGILFADTGAKYAERLSREHRLISQLIDQLPSFIGFRHRFHENFTNWLPFHWRGFHQTSRYTYLLPDLSDPERLWSEMRSTTRSRINRARKSGLVADQDLSFDAFLVLNDKTFSRQGLANPIPSDLLERVDLACRVHAGRRIVAARDRSGTVHAAVYVVWHNGTAYYLMGGSEPSLRSSGASSLAMWEAIKFSAGVAARFDFEGSVMEPIEHAFRGLGGRQTPYAVIRKSHAARPVGLKANAARIAGGFKRLFRS